MNTSISWIKSLADALKAIPADGKTTIPENVGYSINVETARDPAALHAGGTRVLAGLGSNQAGAVVRFETPDSILIAISLRKGAP